MQVGMKNRRNCYKSRNLEFSVLYSKVNDVKLVCIKICLDFASFSVLFVQLFV